MYPPRSGSRQGKKRTSRRRRRRVWAWINVMLLLMITGVLAYSFMDDNNQDSSPPPPVSPVTSSSPEAAATEALPTGEAPGTEAVATATATATPEPAPERTQEATPVPAETAEAAATPAPTEQAVATDAPQATPAGAASGLVSGLPENTSGGTVKLSFAGDIIFSGKAGELLQKKGYDYSYSALDGMFKKDDLTVVNLETPITTRGVGAKNKQFVFKGPPKALDALQSAGVDAVNLANNHTLDQGEEGLLDTLKHLSERGIPHVGAGKNSKEAYSAQFFERKGIKIALLGFTRVMPVIEWKAEAGKPGLASVYDSAEALRAIAAAKQQADVVVVVVHWGRERMEQYDKTQQAMGHSFIDAGADLVMGGHPHVLQGIEPYKGKWIAYSTGNFIFTRGSVPATWETAVFQAECSKQGQCSLKLKPMDAELAQPVPMNEADGQLLLHRVESISSGLIQIRNDGTVTQAVK
ncbi:CapA family protein [Paenibacillus tritici]|uniref:CapA family protein n=1 Tax=Paenibacillus tritici TaxID=1873425 RepID=A0ABX2DVS9_9BACL|nr:CapA family protein [Paenibacillus tritici]NQX48093.1 CapA family protein [Paenibacillus tritici]